MKLINAMPEGIAKIITNYLFFLNTNAPANIVNKPNIAPNAAPILAPQPDEPVVTFTLSLPVTETPSTTIRTVLIMLLNM